MTFPAIRISPPGVTQKDCEGEPEHTKDCPDCMGDGMVECNLDYDHPCPTCHGAGVVECEDPPEEEAKDHRNE